MARGNIEAANIGRFSLNEGSTREISAEFPLGEAYHAINLYFSGVYTVSTAQASGITAKDQAFLHMLSQIQLETDFHGLICNIPGKALRYINEIKYQSQPDYSFSPVYTAAAAYAFRALLTIPFEDPLMKRPEDTLLDTELVSKMTLTIGLRNHSESYSGTVAALVDALTTANVDIEIIKSKGRLAAEAKPKQMVKYAMVGSPFNPSIETEAKHARSVREAIKRTYVWSGNGATGTLARTTEHFSGTGNDATLTHIQTRSDLSTHMRNRRTDPIQADNEQQYRLPGGMIAGLHVLDYVRDGSHNSSLPTGDKTELLTELTTEASLPSGTNVISVMDERIVLL